MLAILILILRIAMLIALFSFLGWTMFIIWRDLKFQSKILVSRKIPHISIFLENDQVESKRIFTQPELTIGRDPSSDIYIDHETASARHARVTYRNMQWWVEDLLSTNGTFLNEERVETPTILINGDELRVGKVVLIIEIQSVN